MKPKNPYKLFDNYCLRTPLLSLTFYQKLTEEKIITEEGLKEIWSNSTIKEAIFLSSPELYTEIEKWASGAIKHREKIERLQISFLKYLSRMSSRCTPFGLFAGCSMGNFSKATNIELEDYQKNKRQTRFDMNFLVAFSQKLSKEENIKDQLLWFPNNSIYKVGTQYRYIEYSYNTSNQRTHSIEAVGHTPYLQQILEYCRDGKKVDDISKILIDDEITFSEAKEFIYELIDNQILISELEPSVTGNDFLSQIEDTLSRLENQKSTIHSIRNLQNFLSTIDEQLGNQNETYLTCSEKIKEFDVSFEIKYLFQTDMYPHIKENKLDQNLKFSIRRAMEILNKITLPNPTTNLSKFRNAFVKRYETREVELSKVLDTEVGIGYIQNQTISDHTPFLEDLYIPQKSEPNQTLIWNRVYDILFDKLQKATHQSLYSISLSDEDFQDLEIRWNDLPDTMSSIAEVITLEGQTKVVLSHMSGSSAANLLGRFSTGNSSIAEQVQKIASIEQHMAKEKLLAEIVHLPEARTGNVIRREAIRDYEIPYLGKSNLPKENQIPIDDLMISVKYNKIVLRSKKLNKEVIPRLTNAHNFSHTNSLPIYRFLCELQTQNIRGGIGFNWGELEKKTTFLPRVEYKNIILSKARWQIKTKNILHIIDHLNSNRNELIRDIDIWKDNLQMPQYVQLINRDNTLLINLQNISSIIMLLHTVKNKKEFILEEFLFTENSPVKSDNKNYTNQFVFSVYNEEKLNHITN